MELAGKRQAANDLYERALSIRRHQTRLSRTRKQYQVRLGDIPNVLWTLIMGHCSLQDLEAFSSCCKVASALRRRYQTVLWAQSKRRLAPSSIPNAGNLFGKSGNQYSPQFPMQFMPISNRFGERCRFTFQASAAVQQNLSGCLRVAAAYTLYLFGLPEDAQTFIGRYDPERGTVLQCSLEAFLSAAFYQLPCVGQYYHLQRFVLSGLGLPKIGGLQVRTHLHADEQNTIEEAMCDYATPPTTSDSSGFTTVIHNAKGKWFELCTCGFGDFGERRGVSKQSYEYHNLIADFSKHDLVVEPIDPDHRCPISVDQNDAAIDAQVPDTHIAHLSRRAIPRPEFNHASMQCNCHAPRLFTDDTRHTFCKESRTTVDHIHMAIHDIKNKTTRNQKSPSIIITTRYRTIQSF